MNLIRICIACAAAGFCTAAVAQQVLSGHEAHQRLAGRHFDFHCVDGTRGQASYAKSGVATASYRLPTARADDAVQRDRGRVRANGDNLCIRWDKLNGGQEGCYKTTERQPGVYRIAEGKLRWCELTAGPGDRAEMD